MASDIARQYTQRVLTQQALMMPYKENGDVDWKTLGNILTGKIIGEVLYASYVDMKHRVLRPSFIVDTDWKYAYEENGVVVLKKQFPDSPFHCWMGRTVIDLPLEEIATYIADPDSALVFDKYVVESTVVEVISQSDVQSDAVAYYRDVAKQCLVKTQRDFLFYIRYAHIDGRYVQTAMSVDHPLCPPRDGIPRGQIQPGSGWVLEPYMGSSQRTMISYLAHVDLVGLPPIIANRVLKRQPLNILYIKRHLMARQQQQQDSVSLLPRTRTSTEQDSDHERKFEEPLPIKDFTNESRMRRTSSDP